MYGTRFFASLQFHSGKPERLSRLQLSTPLSSDRSTITHSVSQSGISEVWIDHTHVCLQKQQQQKSYLHEAWGCCLFSKS